MLQVNQYLPAAVAVLALGSPAGNAQQASELPARVIVKLRPTESTGSITAQQLLAQERQRPSDAVIAALSARAGVGLSWVRALADGSHVFVPTVLAADLSGQTLAERLRTSSDVARSDADLTLMPQSVSDPHFSYLWSLKPPVSGSFGADFESAWDLREGASSVRVAVIDTGILPHPDLVGAQGVWLSEGSALAHEGYDFISDCRIRATCPAATASSVAAVEPQPQALDRGDWISEADRTTNFFSKCAKVSSSWHGSHTSGTVAALANDEGIVGGAYGAKIVPVRALGKCGGYLSDIAEAIRWAAGVHPTISNPAPARIINLSLGAKGTCETTLQSAIDAASAAGALVVAAAGNEADDASKSMLPSCSNVVAIAASTVGGDLAYYSNYSTSRITLTAPGGDMRSTSSAGILSLANLGTTVHDATGWTYRFAQGTSSAAPHVSAAAALMLSRNGALSPARLKTLLTAPTSVTPFPSGSRCASEGICGAGLLNVQRAVSNSLSPLRPSVDILDYGSMALGGAATRELRFTNESTAAITLASPEFGGAEGFALTSDECSGRTLTASESCEMHVTFTSSAEGPVSATLQLPTNSETEAVVAAVQLTALVGSRLTSASPGVTLSNWTIGDTRHVTVAFQTRYSATEQLASIYLSDTEQSAISADDCSNRELAAGSTCEVEVTITPVRSGALAVGAVANTTGAGDVPFTVTISGEVAAPTPPPPGDTGSGGSANVGTSGAGKSGGGGSLNALFVLLLASVGLLACGLPSTVTSLAFQ